MKLEQEIINWAEERGIFEKSNPLRQHDKTLEEVIELRDAIVVNLCEKSNPSITPDTELNEVKDGIGDTAVTLVLLCKMYGLTIEECIQHAFDEIKDRKGKMVNGVFVKKES